MKRFDRVTLVAALLLPLSVGCVSYQWETNIEQAEQRAKVEKRPLFVFYRAWLSPETSRVENDVIGQQDVFKLFQSHKSVNCLIDDVYKPNAVYMAKHGVDRAPALLIKTPDGTYYKQIGFVPKDAVLKWAQQALSAPAARPAQPPPVTPKRAP